MSRSYSGPVQNLTIPSGNEMFQSVEGRREPHQGYDQTFVPSTGFGQPVLNSRYPNLGTVPYQKAPNTLNMAIRLKSLNGVLPCRGITHHVLRGPPPNPNNQQAPQGIGRGERKGLAYGMDWEPHNISLNASILDRASSVSRTGISHLGNKY